MDAEQIVAMVLAFVMAVVIICDVVWLTKYQAVINRRRKHRKPKRR